MEVNKKMNPYFNFNLSAYKIFFQNIFSIKNTETHKVFSVLGLKIKIKKTKERRFSKELSCNYTLYCTGCGACEAVCPLQAITMVKNSQGFLYPEIDKTTCTGCNLCKSVCQTDHWQKTINSKTRQCYAAINKNAQQHLESVDGGVAFVLAKYIISNGGYFCGAAWKNGVCRHIIIDKIEDFELMRGSKYMQSDINVAIYKQIKHLLDDNKPVGFIGTPCQVSGLKLFLGNDYKNLLTTDLICHGVSSLDTFYSFARCKGVDGVAARATYLNYRDKTNYRFNYDFRIGIKSDKEEVYMNRSECANYGLAYLRGLIMRQSCFNCDFCTLNRTGDITLGTFQSIGTYFRTFADVGAVSQIFINNNQGDAYWKRIKSNLKLKKAKVKAYQLNLRRPLFKCPNYEKFFEQIAEDNFDEVVEKLLNIDNNVAILNYHWENTNYGAILTSFALNHYINSLGLNAYNIDYKANFAPEHKDTLNFEEFRKKYIPLTYKCETEEDLEYLNTYFASFVVGSDQVFRWEFTKRENGVYYLNFVNDDNKKIAYAASFGIPAWEGGKDATQSTGLLLSRFGALSVREASGTDILRNIFKMRSKHVLDPVFLLEAKKWEKMASNFVPDKPVFYIIGDTLREKLKVKLKGYTDIRHGLSVEDWITAFKNAPMVITDSFHGVCFCLIFKRQFICVVEEHPLKERISSLFKMFNIAQKKMIVGAENFDPDKEIMTIDYSDFDRLLEKHREASKKFLEDALFGENEAAYNPYYFANLESNKRFNKKYMKRKLSLYKIMSEITFGKTQMRYREKLAEVKSALSMRKYWK